jgi:hypothetical protein
MPFFCGGVNSGARQKGDGDIMWPTNKLALSIHGHVSHSRGVATLGRLGEMAINKPSLIFILVLHFFCLQPGVVLPAEAVCPAYWMVIV